MSEPLQKVVVYIIECIRDASQMQESWIFTGYARRPLDAATSACVMPTPDSTCWTVIRAAAAGSAADRDGLARRYLGVVRAYLATRWRGSRLLGEPGDAVQEVLVECFRRGCALEAVGAGRVPGFRAFLYGVVRNVARRFESTPAPPFGPLPPEIDANEDSQSRLFDRAWAQAIIAEAAALLKKAETSTAKGVAAIEVPYGLRAAVSRSSGDQL